LFIFGEEGRDGVVSQNKGRRRKWLLWDNNTIKDVKNNWIVNREGQGLSESPLLAVLLLCSLQKSLFLSQQQTHLPTFSKIIIILSFLLK
jgi:hypothetical protein